MPSACPFENSYDYFFFRRVLSNKKKQMSTLGITLFIVLCLLAAEVGAEISVEKYSRAFGTKYEKKERWFMVGGVFLYLAIPFLLLWLLRSSNHLTMANTMWQASNIVVVALYGVLVLKESLTIWQKVGIALAIAATVLISIEGSKKATVES